MRIDTKKYLFWGPQKLVNNFFDKVQELGAIQFVDKIDALSNDFLSFNFFIKFIQENFQEDEFKEELTEEQAEAVLLKIQEYKLLVSSVTLQIKELDEELKLVAPFGNFSVQDIQSIELTTGFRWFFFSLLKKNSARVFEEEPEWIKVNEDLDNFYFCSIVTTEPETSYPINFIKIKDSKDSLLRKRRELLDKLELEKTQISSFVKYRDCLLKVCFKKINKHLLDISQAETKVLCEDSIFSIVGWVSVDKIVEINDLAVELGVCCDELDLDENEVSPTYLLNEGSNKIGQDLVEIYDTPSSTDADPSRWVLFSFITFFSMIVGDAGYGLLVLLGGLLLKKAFKKGTAAQKRMVKMAFYIAFGSIVWGGLAPGFFGKTAGIDSAINKVAPLRQFAFAKARYYIKNKPVQYQKLVEQYPQIEKETTAIGFLKSVSNTTEGSVEYPLLNDFVDSANLDFAFLIGIIHISMACLRYFRRKISGLGWILAMIGGYIAFPVFLNTLSLANYVLQLSPEFCKQVGIWLVYGGFGFAVVSAIIKSSIRGLEEITVVIQVFSDVMSYVRIYALAFAGAVVASTVNSMASKLPVVFGGLVLLLGHAINFTLSMMGGVVHGLRLNFIEWYHYSFEGGGKMFKPFKKIKEEDLFGEK